MAALDTAALQASFADFVASPLRQLQVAIRQQRAQELRDLLADPATLTVEAFDREVWVLESSASIDGEPLPHRSLLFDDNLPDTEIERRGRALSEGRLEFHGNSMWGSATRVFGAQLKLDVAGRQDLIRRAAEILNQGSLSPMEKAEAVLKINGFGPNVGTGLVMVFHPDDFAIYNGVSQRAVELLGREAKPLTAFEDSVRALRDEVGATDFIEFDWFLYQLANDLKNRTPSDPAAARVWMVRAGEGAALKEFALEHSCVVIGWDALEDLTTGITAEEMRATMLSSYDYADSPAGRGQITKHIHEIESFRDEITIGDVVITPLSLRALAVGEVEGPYEWIADNPQGCRHTRKVRWLDTDVPRERFGSTVRDQLNIRKTVHEIDGTDKSRILRMVAGEQEVALSVLLQLTMDAVEARNAESSPETLDTLKQLVEHRVPAQLQQMSEGRTAKGSFGHDYNPAHVPWVAVVAEGESASAQEGYYPVYLFAADGSAVALSFNQAAEKLGFNPLRKRAIDLRRAGGLADDAVDTDIDLQSPTERPRKYEAASAYSVTYGSGNVPADSALLDDLTTFIEISDRAHRAGLVFDPESEPVHLLFKGATLESIDEAERLAAGGQSVWWGHGQSLKAAWEVAIQAQLDRGVQTLVYLHGANVLWQANIHHLQADPPDSATTHPLVVDSDSPQLYVHLSAFQRLDPAWAATNLVTTTSPVVADMPAALVNSADPLVVYRLFPSPGPTGDPMETLIQQTLWPKGNLEELLDALMTRKQIILAGPPGTGKTWVAKHLAYYLRAGKTDGVRVVQFHPSYGYEDFIEGLRPVAEGNQIEFKIVKGVVRQAVDDVREGEPYIIVIDEMNRANLPRVFGELMYALEYRGPENPVELQYSGDSRDFFLPEDLLFIGTMNTADRSIRSIDVALRRRFEIFECFPDAEVLERFYETPGRDNAVPDLLDGFQKLNERLTADLDRHHTVGQTFFMSEKMTGQRLQRVWRRQLHPLIEEYFFDQPDVARSYQLEEFWLSQS